MNFKELREKMVGQQLAGRDIKDKRVLDAFLKVERHRFVGEEAQSSAYADYPLPIGANQTISQPYMVALMTQLLDLKGTEKVLEIGTGSGYQAAILAELAKTVYSIERISSLADKAQKVLNELGYKNINIKVDDGTLGWQEISPFDAIIVTAASPEIPQTLVKQLTEGGKLVLPVGGTFGQMLVLVKKQKGKIDTKEICGCVFVPLIGKYGYNK
ncbi:MAG TPA: protein-L-isoaspartate(D-aspartate) O-methyltransferase [Candidatus Omnitrophota bacterium]|nr:protein-L-isoaspartate(D-aspartate) O-methyltransferase [Candidatus Omnitrophota bacterium]